jgi:hypothetical protein
MLCISRPVVAQCTQTGLSKRQAAANQPPLGSTKTCVTGLLRCFGSTAAGGSDTSIRGIVAATGTACWYSQATCQRRMAGGKEPINCQPEMSRNRGVHLKQCSSIVVQPSLSHSTRLGGQGKELLNSSVLSKLLLAFRVDEILRSALGRYIPSNTRVCTTYF